MIEFIQHGEPTAKMQERLANIAAECTGDLLPQSAALFGIPDWLVVMLPPELCRRAVNHPDNMDRVEVYWDRSPYIVRAKVSGFWLLPYVVCIDTDGMDIEVSDEVCAQIASEFPSEAILE